MVEAGSDVEFVRVGDLCSVPFDVACKRCRNCREQHTDVRTNVDDHPGGAYVYVDLGGWTGGQAEYVM